jgi:hypothetical protein
MDRANKVFTLILILILTIASLSLITVKSTNAQSTSSAPMKPLVPEFSLKYINSQKNVTITNPDNGQEITQQVDNSTVELVIKNQPYPYAFQNTTYVIYYDIQTKSHFTQDWIELYPLTYRLDDFWYGTYSWYISAGNPSFPSSNSSLTTLLLPSKLYPINTDFQVKAIVGHNSTYYIPPQGYQPPLGRDNSNPFARFYITPPPAQVGVAYDNSSDWSSTQTVSFPEPSPTPNVPELSWLLIVPLLLSMLSVAVILRYRKTPKA